jgi:hypothetical protein
MENPSDDVPMANQVPERASGPIQQAVRFSDHHLTDAADQQSVLAAVRSGCIKLHGSLCHRCCGRSFWKPTPEAATESNVISGTVAPAPPPGEKLYLAGCSKVDRSHGSRGGDLSIENETVEQHFAAQWGCCELQSPRFFALDSLLGRRDLVFG